MATGVTGASPYAAAPPPPPINPIAGAGGSRKNKHIVGGSTSNVAYTPGANLLAARQGYQQNLGSASQNAMQRGFFQGQNQRAPDFSAVATNSMQAGQGLTPGQAMGNTLNQHSLGQVRPTNAPAGLGFGRSNSLGLVRQHTLTGNEATDSGMTYTPTAAPPPPPPPPTVRPPEPGTNPGPNATPTQTLDYSKNLDFARSEIMAGRYDAFLNHPDPGIKQLAVNAKKAADLAREQANSTQYNTQTTNSGGAGWHHVTPTAPAPPATVHPGVGTVAPGTPPPVPVSIGSNQSIRQSAAGWSIGNFVSSQDGTKYKITGARQVGNIRVPTITNSKGQQVVHPAWQELL